MKVWKLLTEHRYTVFIISNTLKYYCGLEEVRANTLYHYLSVASPKLILNFNFVLHDIRRSCPFVLEFYGKHDTLIAYAGCYEK